ncbi:1-deoxy-D-xylulose-5-phosphate synthase [Kangiella spongicola]|uniref:1-deoxy-D-xylulose-5-phosphate synthase n=1 Tax=Kangiella spongicola TaxID=796379 RepID=A0A318D2J9_9GAMM|nr:1-deoxy-D-xylulose-5-phosphate synthase [Kangiella spongicola]PXF63466.1 1-deoxy-D-xylulose-5-phosphate synthase [Kangiella spongicola]
MSTDLYPLLKQINNPHDLRELNKSQLGDVANELRQYLINTISQCGGHFAAGLGTVELTVALHYIFNTPDDRIVWDVGHQAYPHKVLTERREQLHTIRQTDGLHPFPVRSESEYDTFAVGHSSTSISAALGMALAAKQSGENRQCVAVIGDGALTGGMAFEAMNHAADTDANLLVILNDNEMSISENVGGMNRYLAKLLAGRFYQRVRETGKKALHGIKPLSEFVSRAEEHMKGMMLPSTLFEELGFNYNGPIDGHDLPTLLSTLSNIKSLKGPQFLHVVTRKGKGYEPAENDPIAYHGVPIFDPKIDELPKGVKPKTYSNIFGDFLCDIAAQDERVMGITPAMREGSDLIRFSKEFPERYHDVGIAEQHAVTVSAGLACEGFKPVCAIYSTFLQRGYDQLIHDVALQNLDVLFAVDRGGLVGGDGATHNGAFDLSYLRCIPNMVIMAPSDENECRQCLYTGYLYEGPVAVRYPRGMGSGIEPEKHFTAFEIGKGRLVKESTKQQGEKVAILAFGSMVKTALEAAEKIDATVADMRFVKPLDEQLIRELADSHDLFITIEENAVQGGAGSAINEFILNNDLQIKVRNLGLPDRFIEHGSTGDLLERIGLTADDIVKVVS